MKHMLKPLAVVALALLIAVPAAFAQISEQSTLPVTEPLDVGGTVLQPGTYVIRLAPGDDHRNIVQVTNADQTEVLASIHTVPHQFGPGESMPNTTFVYYPAGEGAPAALRTWYASYPASAGGHDIVYQETRAKQLARLASSSVVAYDKSDQELHVVTPQATVETYTPPPPRIVETPAPAPRVAGATETRQVADSRPMDMPHTAGSLPLIALLGVLLLGGALAVRLVR